MFDANVAKCGVNYDLVMDIAQKVITAQNHKRPGVPLDFEQLVIHNAPAHFTYSVEVE